MLVQHLLSVIILAILVGPFTPDGIGNAGTRHEIALVTTVDEHFGTDTDGTLLHGL